MEISKLIKTLLVISGAVGIGIGGALLLDPVAFEASSGISLPEDINLLSEIRAPGGALLAGGILIVAGAFVSKLTHTSLILSSLLYLSYGFSRIVSIIIDGIPNESLVLATIAEVVIGLLSIIALLNFRRKHNQS